MMQVPSESAAMSLFLSGKLDFSNIESGQEQKFYAPGTGLLKETDVNGNEEVVLTNMTRLSP